MEEYIEKAPTMIKKNKGKPLSQNTISSYKTTALKIKAFEEHKNTLLKLTDINLSLHKKFMEYLNKMEKLAVGIVWAVIKNLNQSSQVRRSQTA